MFRKFATLAAVALIGLAACNSTPSRPDAASDPYGAQLATWEAAQDAARTERERQRDTIGAMSAQCPQCSSADDGVCNALRTMCVTSLSRDVTLLAGSGSGSGAGQFQQPLPQPPPPAPSKWRSFTGGLFELASVAMPLANVWAGDRANRRLVDAQIAGQQIDANRELGIAQVHGQTAGLGFNAITQTATAGFASTAQTASIGFTALADTAGAGYASTTAQTQAWAEVLRTQAENATPTYSSGGAMTFAGRDADQSSTGGHRTEGGGNEVDTTTSTECYASNTGSPISVTTGTTGSATGGTTGSPTVPGSANGSAQPGAQSNTVTCRPRG